MRVLSRDKTASHLLVLGRGCEDAAYWVKQEVVGRTRSFSLTPAFRQGFSFEVRRGWVGGEGSVDGGHGSHGGEGSG